MLQDGARIQGAQSTQRTSEPPVPYLAGQGLRFFAEPWPVCRLRGSSTSHRTSPEDDSTILSRYRSFRRSMVRSRRLHLPVFRWRSSPTFASRKGRLLPGSRAFNFMDECNSTVAFMCTVTNLPLEPHAGHGRRSAMGVPGLSSRQVSHTLQKTWMDVSPFIGLGPSTFESGGRTPKVAEKHGGRESLDELRPIAEWKEDSA